MWILPILVFFAVVVVIDRYKPYPKVGEYFFQVIAPLPERTQKEEAGRDRGNLAGADHKKDNHAPGLCWAYGAGPDKEIVKRQYSQNKC